MFSSLSLTLPFGIAFKIASCMMSAAGAAQAERWHSCRHRGDGGGGGQGEHRESRVLLLRKNTSWLGL
jgi:hypothetical protein